MNSPRFLLEMTRCGASFSLFWEPLSCRLLTEDGTPVPIPLVEDVLPPSVLYGPFALHSFTFPVILTLGHRCNYRCQYCLQAPSGYHDGTDAPNDQALLNGLVALSHGHGPLEVTWWGGEPLLYMDDIRRLTPLILDLLPDATFNIISNGSLLTRERVDFIIKHNMAFRLSHDGPQQHLRSGDPLTDPVTGPLLHELHRTLGPMFSINPVSVGGGVPLKVMHEFFTTTFGGPVLLGECAPAYPMPGSEPSPFTPDGPEQLGQYYYGLVDSLMTGDSESFVTPMQYVAQFLRWLGQGEPLQSGGRCIAFSPHPTVLDIQGRVLTCMSVGPEYQAGCGASQVRGHLSDLAGVQRPNLPGWDAWPVCRQCPVVPLCKGDCPFVDGEAWQQRCRAAFHHYMALFTFALARITDGGMLAAVHPFPLQDK